jgi:hypothetical protein
LPVLPGAEHGVGSHRHDRKLSDGTLRPIRIVYRRSQAAGEMAVFIPGMVVPAGG